MDPRGIVVGSLLAIACTPAESPDARALPTPELEPTAEVLPSTPVPVVPDTPRKAEPAAPVVARTPRVDALEEDFEPGPPWVDASAAARENWLVWSISYGEPSTRWVVTTTKASRIAGDRADLVVADGDRMWRIEHTRTEAPVYACMCFDWETGRRFPGCEPSERIDRPGLRAIDLDTRAATTIVDASGEPLAAGDAAFGLEITGGVGATLFVSKTDEGYFCGAHPIEERTFEIFDIVAGAAKADVLAEVFAALPEGVLRQGRQSTRQEIEACYDDEDGLREALGEPLYLDAVGVRVEEGRAIVTWDLQRGLPHWCASDYTAWGSVETRLIPEGAALGLVGPLPPAVAATLREIGDADAIGWSRLDLEGEAVREALARFRGEEYVPPPSR